MDNSKNGRWIVPFKKFSRLRVKLNRVASVNVIYISKFFLQSFQDQNEKFICDYCVIGT